MLEIDKTPKNRKIFHIYHEGVEYKRCSTCQIWQDVVSFCKAQNWDGLHKTCKKCQSKNYQSNKVVKNKQRLDYQRKNKEKLNLKRKQNRKEKTNVINEYFREYHKNRKNEDTVYHFSKNVRRLIQHAFVGFGERKNTKTKTILGLSNWSDFNNHLLKTFEKNYHRIYNPNVDVVHIDHIVPLSTALNIQDVEKLNHFLNLQLLLAKDNIAKSNKVNWSLSHGS